MSQHVFNVSTTSSHTCSKSLCKAFELAMLEKYHKLQLKPKTIKELKIALELIWDDLPQEPINKAIKSFTKRLRTCVAAGGGHIEHML